jgi:hypothetical protein
MGHNFREKKLISSKSKLDGKTFTIKPITTVMEQCALKNVNNGKESTVNRALGGSTYPG